MKYLIIVLLLILTGCYTEKKAARQMDRAHGEHEVVAAGRCAVWYPVRIDTTYGKPIIIRTTETIPGQIMWVDCDSFNKAAFKDTSKDKPMSSAANKVAVQCPPSKIIHDSVDRPVFIKGESSAALKAEKLRHVQTATQLHKEQGRANTLKWLAISLGVLLAVAIIVIVLILKLKIKAW